MIREIHLEQQTDQQGQLQDQYLIRKLCNMRRVVDQEDFSRSASVGSVVTAEDVDRMIKNDSHQIVITLPATFKL